MTKGAAGIGAAGIIISIVAALVAVTAALYLGGAVDDEETVAVQPPEGGRSFSNNPYLVFNTDSDSLGDLKPTETGEPPAPTRAPSPSYSPTFRLSEPSFLFEVQNTDTTQFLSEDFLKKAGELLALSAVDDRELNIDASGANTVYNYLIDFTSNFKSIGFDISKFVNVKTDGGGMPFTVNELIDIGLKYGDFSSVGESLAVWKGFIEAKIAYLKKMKVASQAAEFNKKMIGIDMLTVALISKAGGLKDLAGFSDLEDYYQKYQNTINVLRGNFNKEIGFFYEPPKEDNVLVRLLRELGLYPNLAQAQGQGFGGRITLSLTCSCSGGSMLTLFPGYNPMGPSSVKLFLSYATQASPLFYMNKNANIGRWILGKYMQIPGQCEQISYPKCTSLGNYDGYIIKAGTS